MAGDWGRGWGVYDMQCAACGHEWKEVAPIGTQDGAQCPDCGAVDPCHVWSSKDDELPNDGAWLTGETSLSLVGEELLAVG